MTELERVLKGLNAHKRADCRDNACPYATESHCLRNLIEDAIGLLKEPKWISVEEALPNCNGCYMVWRPHFYQDCGMPSICYFDGSDTWHDSYGVDFTRILNPEDVTHWMPLPEGP